MLEYDKLPIMKATQTPETKTITPPQSPVEHTPTLWVMEGKTLLHIETANVPENETCGNAFCSLPKSKREWADKIVRAVNSHAAMVEALEVAKATLHRVAPCQPYDSTQGTRDVIDAALALAKGE
jgi:hypothetical protein